MAKSMYFEKLHFCCWKTLTLSESNAQDLGFAAHRISGSQGQRAPGQQALILRKAGRVKAGIAHIRAKDISGEACLSKMEIMFNSLFEPYLVHT